MRISAKKVATFLLIALVAVGMFLLTIAVAQGQRPGEPPIREMQREVHYDASPSVLLVPPSATGTGTPGSTVVYIETALNRTGVTDSFTLTVSGNAWTTTLSISNTGSISDEASIGFTVQVDIPPVVILGTSDVVTVTATSMLSPTVYSDSATITTTALCSPVLVFSGQSAQTWDDLDDVYNYGGQKLIYAYVYGFTNDNDTLDATVSGYDPGSGTWQTVTQQSGGSSGVIADQFFAPPTYTRLRVQLDDTENDDLIYYDYQFIVCREPAVALNPPAQRSLVQAGTTAVYTQTVTNYMMAADSFDLSATGNTWLTTFWNGPTQITNTGPLADLETFTFTVEVEVPPAASMGDSDVVTVRARSVASPVISDTASLGTVVRAYPWAQTFEDRWAPDGSTDGEQYLDIVRSSGIVTAQVTDDGGWPSSPPAVAAYPRDAVVVAWAGPYRWSGTTSYYNIEYAASDADGNTVIPVTQVSDNVNASIYTQDRDPAPAVAPTDGNVLIAWYRDEDDFAGNWSRNVYYAVRGPAGSEVLSPTALTTNTTSAVRDYYPSAAAFGDGRFAVAWQHVKLSTGVSDIYYAVLNSAGNPLVGPVNLTNNASESDYMPRANRLNDGNVLLAWTNSYGFGSEIYYAVLDSTGNVVYPITRLTNTPSGTYQPDAVGLRNGNTVVAWEQYGYYAGQWERQMAYAVLDSAYTTTVPITMAAQILTNTLENQNYSVSLARDGDDNAVLTWRDDGNWRIYYAVVDNSGAVRTWPIVFRTTRGGHLDISWWGAGNGSLPARALSIRKTDSPDPVTAGGLLTHTIIVHNTAETDATDVTITDTVPAHTAFVSASAGGLPAGSQSVPGGTSPPGNYVQWSGRTIPAGESLTVTLVLRVDSLLPAGTVITNTNYGATCAEGEVASGSPVTTAVQPAPVLRISKADRPDPVAAGNLLTYTVTVQNIGYAGATGVTISDTLPVSTTFVSADSGGALVGDQVQWTGKTVGAGSSLTVRFTVRVEGPPDGPPIVNWYYGVTCNESPTPVMGPPVTTWRRVPGRPSTPGG